MVDLREYGSEPSVSMQYKFFFVKISSDFFAVVGLFSFMKPPSLNKVPCRGMSDSVFCNFSKGPT